MRDRWRSRWEPTSDEGTVYWHMLAHRYTEARGAAAEVRKRLAPFDGFHITPDKWLHATTLVAGSTEKVSREQMQAMAECAQDRLASDAPIPVTTGRILYHPEAIMLDLSPAEALHPVLEAARLATDSVLGHGGELSDSMRTWAPHVTVAYSVADQPAGPIIAALGKSVPERRFTITSLDLVVQWGPERLWNWEPVATVQIGQKRK